MALLPKATPERLSAFSDGVFAVLITVLVLELRPPEDPTFEALLSLWPTWLSYAVSYLFIAIVWANHHYLMRYATEAASRLLWFNFAHLFSMSLLPLSTAWMATSRLAPQPVRGGRAGGAEISAGCTRNLYRLSDCLSQARSAGGGVIRITAEVEF
jgi:uncharacterized membrane protein